MGENKADIQKTKAFKLTTGKDFSTDWGQRA